MVAVMLKDDVLDTGDRGKRKTIDYTASGVIDDCRHSSKTFAQAYMYAVDKMSGRVGMGSDFNGVAGHFGPRFGSKACGGVENLLILDSNVEIDRERSAQLREGHKLQYPFTLAGFGTLGKQVSGQKAFDYNVDGLAHVGLLPDFVADLKVDGLSNADLNPLMHSAEEYIKLWERARGESSPSDPCNSAPGPTFTAAPTNTPTPTPTWTPTPTAAQARITVERAVLDTWRMSQRDNGRLLVTGILDDSRQGGTLLGRILTGGFEIRVSDGDRSFDVTAALTNCRLRRPTEMLCRHPGPQSMWFTLVAEPR
jgi:hypothetical protein